MSSTSSSSSSSPAAAPPVDIPYPSAKTMVSAARFAISQDKPIVLDYWVDSVTMTGERSNAVLGIRKDGNKMLVKSNGEEYTSNIKKIYNCENEYLVETENSIYIVSKQISQKRVN